MKIDITEDQLKVLKDILSENKEDEEKIELKTLTLKLNKRGTNAIQWLEDNKLIGQLNTALWDVVQDFILQVEEIQKIPKDHVTIVSMPRPEWKYTTRRID